MPEIKPEGVTPEEPTTEPEPTPNPEEPAPSEPAPTSEWEDKYAGQLKVNRDLEKKLKAERDSREALEIQLAPAEEQAAAKARAEVEKELTGKANSRILKSELRASATGKLADPADAALYIDLSQFDVGDDGEVDSDALNDAITDLLTRKPHLAAGKPNRFDGDADQGARGKSDTIPQWTEVDLERASDDETVAAKAAGKLNRLLGIKT